MGEGKRFVKNWLILVVVLFSFLPIVYAEPPTVIVNSKDWRDVYSGMLYANLLGYPNYFINAPAYSKVVLNFVSPRTEKVIAITSPTQAYTENYKTIIESINFEAEEIRSTNINLELARRLPDIKSFIIIDDAYGYNAIAVGSYAAVSKSYVLFANSRNIGQVSDFLEQRAPNSVLIYGQVNREVKTALATYNPEIINEGDRFDDNLKLIDKYLAIKPRQQVILTNGEFIESSLMSGDDPVIFIGRANVPDVIREYIKKSDFKVAILIGNELIGPAQFIRRQIGISVFVKFAQGARTPSGSVNTVEDLDRFPLPRYNLGIGVYEVVYNQLTKQLEVTYNNLVAQPLYILPTVSIVIDGNEITLESTEKDVIFLDGNGYKTIIYNANITQEELVDALAKVYVLFGEGRRSLEFVYENTTKISTLSVLDNSAIQIESLVYDKFNKRFEAVIKNVGESDVYVTAELVDMMINGERVTIGAQKTLFIEKGKSKKIYIPADTFRDQDVADNPMITIRAYYGERERNLFKSVSSEFQYEQTTNMLIIYIAAGAVLLLFIIFELTRKKCKSCKHKNPFWSKKCNNCGHDLNEK